MDNGVGRDRNFRNNDVVNMSFRGIYGQIGKRDSRGRLLKRTDTSGFARINWGENKTPSLKSRQANARAFGGPVPVRKNHNYNSTVPRNPNASPTKRRKTSSKKKKTSVKRRVGRPSKLPKTKKFTLNGKKRTFKRKSTHSSKKSARRSAGLLTHKRIVKGGRRYGLYTRKK